MPLFNVNCRHLNITLLVLHEIVTLRFEDSVNQSGHGCDVISSCVDPVGVVMIRNAQGPVAILMTHSFRHSDI